MMFQKKTFIVDTTDAPYWHSTQLIQLFVPASDEDMQNVIAQRIDILKCTIVPLEEILGCS